MKRIAWETFYGEPAEEASSRPPPPQRSLSVYNFKCISIYKGNSPKSKEIPKILFLNFFQDFFHLEIFFWEKIFFTISIRNFPRNPKIILRKSCDEFKYSKNGNSKCYYKFCQILMILWYVLHITTLNSLTDLTRSLGWFKKSKMFDLCRSLNQRLEYGTKRDGTLENSVKTSHPKGDE